ncbi:MAG TPA: class I SAM-dependent methyltransferase [Gaiellaceae bacterium]|nr:class I SAM-dependent methyltransferase [Gaiellaceae bacterium]
MATWWSEFNDDFRPHEISYFRRFVEDGGQPALDVACGTGRLLVPYLRAGLDVDGCDVSADMIALCAAKAEREGLSPNLYVQAMHELDLPRAYRTIFVCGAFGLGSDRERDREALSRFHEHLEPGGTLLVDFEVPYADSRLWQYWLEEERASLPESAPPPGAKRRGSDGAEYTLSSRVVELDPLEQHATMEIHAEKWRGETLESEEDRRLDIGLYFKNELLLMLERAGFASIVVQGDHVETEPTSSDAFLVLVARK